MAGKMGFSLLPIEAYEAEFVRILPPIHYDPFDRLLIAQAVLNQCILMTRDANIPHYPNVRDFSR